MKPRGNENVRGFALVLTITLLSLLVIIALAISQTARLGADMSTASRAQIVAKQNALTGFHLALAKLQLNAGPQEARTSVAGLYAGINHVNSLWTATWTPGGRSLEWMVSGEQSPYSYDPNLSVVAGVMPSVGNPSLDVILVGGKSVSTAATIYRDGDVIAVRKVPVSLSSTITSGCYAYWVGDEGTKVSAFVPTASAQAQSSGDPIRPYLRYLVSSQYSPINPLLVDIISYNQIGLLQSGFSPGQAFHGLTLRHSSLLETIERSVIAVNTPYVDGLVNVNNINATTWRAILLAVQTPPSNQPVINYRSKDLSLSRQLVVGIEARGEPFENVDQFEAAHVLQQALVDAGLSNSADPTETDVLALIGPVLTTRSDTFRIRAYGDAMNPADADDPNAKPEAVAYCEAIVQRTNQDDPGGHGKKFVVTYFRWLGPDDI